MPYEIAKTADPGDDAQTVEAPRSLYRAMSFGAAQHCPACGTGPLFDGYLKVRESCSACGEELHHQRADDAPPYFTMLIVGHVIVAGVLALEDAYAPSEWVHAAIWGPLTLAMSLWLLPRVKGALIGLQWALRMHGFGGPESDEPEAPPQPDPART
ncbi:MAG: DUF983 domain-containing protein [Hyphomicrobiaceae bacterium]|nr:DUF983 domain-containing protein [Hyphomicrobiaceae bacterium]